MKQERKKENVQQEFEFLGRNKVADNKEFGK